MRVRDVNYTEANPIKGECCDFMFSCNDTKCNIIWLRGLRSQMICMQMLTSPALCSMSWTNLSHCCVRKR